MAEIYSSAIKGGGRLSPTLRSQVGKAQLFIPKVISAAAHEPPMEINEWFRLPEVSGVAAFAKAQVRLYRHNPCLQDYFLPLQLNFLRNSATAVTPQSVSKRLKAMSCMAGYKTFRHLGRRKYKVDVLFCPMPYFQRQSENRLLMRMFIGLVQTGATMLCLLPESAPCRVEMDSWLRAQGRASQVTFSDPSSVLNPVAARLLASAGRISGTAAFNEIVEVLQPDGLAPIADSKPAFAYTAAFVEAWRCFESCVEFDAAVTRCHWQTLCSPICRTARERGKPVITFQQGVIGHTLDVPVSASKYVAFGSSSARLLERMNRSFFQAVELAEPPVEFIPGGSLFDHIPSLPNQFAKRTLLIIDEPVGADDFYGVGTQRAATICLAQKLLKSSASARIIIRPHPYWDSLGLDAWKEIARTYPDRCELSHAAWTLEEDLSRSSVVLGIFSGALTVAAAAGLPTFFMTTGSGYATEDLACFGTGQSCLPDEAFLEINRVLTDAQAHASASSVALKNSRDYYHEGANLELSAAFFQRILGKDAAHATANLGNHQ